MATDASNDVHAFYQFLGERIETGRSPVTPEESVAEYRAYRDELDRVRAELEQSRQEYLQGKAKPLDVDKLMERVLTRSTRLSANLS